MTVRPGCSTTTHACSAPCTSRRWTWSTETFWPRANPSSALVGLPAASYAACHLGPLRTCSVSGSRAATSSTTATMRRGVPSTRMAPCSRRVAPRRSVRAARTCSTVAGTTCGGSSSTPISRARVCGSVGSAASSTVGSSAAGGSTDRISGWPSSARRSIHRAAVSRMSRRIVAKARARSVVEIAPRASSTLNACEDLRM